MSEFMLGVLCGAGLLVAVCALIVLLLIWRAPVIEAVDEHEGLDV